MPKIKNKNIEFTIQDEKIITVFLQGYLSRKSISFQTGISVPEVNWFFDRAFRKYKICSYEQLFRILKAENREKKAIFLQKLQKKLINYL